MSLARVTSFGRRVSVAYVPTVDDPEEPLPWVVLEETWDDGMYAQRSLSRHASYMGALVAAEGEGGAA